MGAAIGAVKCTARRVAVASCGGCREQPRRTRASRGRTGPASAASLVQIDGVVPVDHGRRMYRNAASCATRRVSQTRVKSTSCSSLANCAFVLRAERCSSRAINGLGAPTLALPLSPSFAQADRRPMARAGRTRFPRPQRVIRGASGQQTHQHGRRARPAP